MRHNALFIEPGVGELNMKLGITVWNDRVAPVFDVAGTVYILDSTADTSAGKNFALPPTTAYAKIETLIQEQVDILVCGAISRPVLRSAQAGGLRVVPFVSASVAEVLQAWSCGKLDETAETMPGCGCMQRGRQNRGKCHSGGQGGGCRGKIHRL